MNPTILDYFILRPNFGYKFCYSRARTAKSCQLLLLPLLLVVVVVLLLPLSLCKETFCTCASKSPSPRKPFA